MNLVGRTRERERLHQALQPGEAELVVVYGRRRVGKTFLIRSFYADEIWFELVGSHGATLAEQLGNFARAIATSVAAPYPLTTPEDWPSAFQMLAALFESANGCKKVLFFDEFPWLAGRRSGFLRAFEHFWNSWASSRTDVVVVICGSAASWMLDRVIGARGGLHNRVTQRIRLSPFTLAETEAYLHSRHIHLGRYQILELYMAMGGIPYYLREVRRGESAAQCIDRVCFSEDGLLAAEFGNLYASLFERSDRHERVVRALAGRRGGLLRDEIAAAVDMGSGGGLTKILHELEACGFVFRTLPIGRIKRSAVYHLGDEYSRFYLEWIAKKRGSSWMNLLNTPRWRAWSGLTFEGICLKHTPQLKRSLGISAVETQVGSWRQAEAQIDLVIHRRDRTTNLCEMKFSEAPFVVTREYANKLRKKRDTYRQSTSSRHTLLLTMVTTFGAVENAYFLELGLLSLTMDALFDDPPLRRTIRPNTSSSQAPEPPED